MKSTLQILGVVVAILTTTNSVTAQWVQTNSLYGGYFRALGVSGTNVFAGAHGSGIFGYNNDDGTWTKLPLGDNTSINAIAFSPDGNGGVNVFVGADMYRDNPGVFCYTLTGLTWTQVNTGLTTSNVAALAVSPNDKTGKYIFAGTWINGVFRSTDNGATWMHVDSGLTEPNVGALAVSPNGMGGINVFAGTTTGIFRSTDNGTYWTRVGPGPAETNISSFAVIADGTSDTSLFAGSWGGGVFHSSDNGMTWVKVDSGLTSLNVTSFAISSNETGGTVIYAGTYGGGVFRSTNEGTSWSEVNTGLSFPYVNSLAVSPDGKGGTRLFAGTWGDGIYLSTNDGASWSVIDSGLIEREVRALAVFPTETGDTILFTGTNDCGVFRSTNDGTTWNRANLGINMPGVNALAVCPNGKGGMKILAGGAGLFVSDDAGARWTQIQSINCNICGFAVSSTTQNHPGVFAGGEIWGTQTAQVFLSTDYAASWSPLGTKLNVPGFNALALYDTCLFAGTSNGVFLSTDSCATWIQRNTGLTDTCVNALTVSPNSVGGFNLFACTREGMFVSTNNGENWVPAGSDSVSTQTQALAICRTTMFAGTQCIGIWKRPLLELTTEAKNSPYAIPQRFQLSQNYPNPFNPSTTIRFSVPMRSHVRLTIFNVLGQRMVELANEEMAAGNFERIWNGNVASGLYLYRVEAFSMSDPNKRFVDVKKMILLK
jgi:hypothetical protein